MKEKIKNLYANKPLRLGIYIIGTLFVLSLAFESGTFVGYHKAGFSRDWGDRYERNFGMMRPDSIKGMMGGRFPTAHGATGKVLTVSLPTFTIEDNDGTEKVIVTSSSTIIKSGRDNVLPTAISTDNLVVVLGEPNADGEIDAKLIRVMPTTTGTSTQNYGRRGMMNGFNGYGMMSGWFNEINNR